MNPLLRASRYASAYFGLERLKQKADSLVDQPAELAALMFHDSANVLAPRQVPEELASLLKEVRSLRPCTVLEIGTDRGGTLFLWMRLADPHATVVSIDLPGGKFGGGYGPLRERLYRRFPANGQILHLLRLDSHQVSTLEHAKQLFGGGQIDFLFIDGDHTYEGIQQDWEMYSPLVRAGGMIVFHDVAGNYEDTQVKRFWDTVKPHFRHSEYIADPGGRFGIGVIYK